MSLCEHFLKGMAAENARYLDRLETPAIGPSEVSNNSCQESVSAWLLCRRFFNTPYTAVLLKAVVWHKGCHRIVMRRLHALGA